MSGCPGCGHEVIRHTTPDAGVACDVAGCRCRLDHFARVPDPDRWTGRPARPYRDPGAAARPLPVDDRRWRAEVRDRDRTYRLAYEAGLAGERFRASEWGDYPDVVAAYESGVAERRRVRRGDRVARLARIRSRLAPRAATRRRVRRWARRHPYAATGALAVATAVVVALVAVVVAVGLVGGLVWLAGRGAASFARTVRAMAAAFHATPAGPAEEPF